MSGVIKISEGDEKQLLEAVATVGPVAVAVDATSKAFRVCLPIQPEWCMQLQYRN